MTRHLSRVGGAIDEALENDCLHKEDLGMVNAYQPNLSAAWMFQKAMSCGIGQNVNPKFVNRLLATNFEVMDNMGDRTMKPFLQDVVRFDALLGSLARSFAADPLFMPEIVATVGVPALVDWLGHVAMVSVIQIFSILARSLGSVLNLVLFGRLCLLQLGTYSFLDSAIAPLMEPVVNGLSNPREKFRWRRQMEAWKYGSGGDYKFPEDSKNDM